MRMKFDMQVPDLINAKNGCLDHAKKVLFKSMVKMEEIAKLKAPVDTGNLKNRIHLSPSYFGAEEYVLSDGVDYGIFVEYGTKPHFVPIAPLKGWAKRVLKDEGLAYAIRYKIAKYGTPAQPFFRPALDEVRYKWMPIFQSEP